MNSHNDKRKKDYRAELSEDARKIPKRVAFIKSKTSAKVRTEDEEMAMTIPNLFIKEVIAFEIVVIVLGIISFFFDAPLEWIANPDHTPNPAKAPWYFLGLQELLHYFPPVVGGVIIPVLAVIALIAVPYFRINTEVKALWDINRIKSLTIFLISTVIIQAVLLWFKVFAMLIPTFILTLFILATYIIKRDTGFYGWLSRRPLSWWIMTWFVINVIILTVIGTYFRGPEWNWTMPWNGVY